MKHLSTIRLLILSCALLCFATAAHAQNILHFDYDAAGNQVKREFLCLGCSTFPAVMEVPLNEQVTSLNDGKKGGKLPGRTLTAYPNPVTDLLTVKWTAEDGSFVKAIELFSVTGVRLYDQALTAEQSQASLSFQQLPAGLYVLRATHSDGKQEMVKIIRQ